MIVWGWRKGGTEIWGMMTKGVGSLFEVMEMFLKLIVVKVAQLCHYTKNCWIVL